jgi:hypothetical protein
MTPRRSITDYRGCLLGGAIGDALGAATEFLSLAEIRRRFGPAGLTDYAEAYGRKGGSASNGHFVAARPLSDLDTRRLPAVSYSSCRLDQSGR